MNPRKLSLALLSVGLAVTLTLGLALGATLLRLGAQVRTQLGEIADLRAGNLNLSSEVYARGGEKIGEFAGEARYYAPLATLPPALVQAFLSAEDKDFYQHYGVSPVAIVRALWTNLRHGAVRQGASTITQQLARLMFLSQTKTWERKGKEALLALAIERQLDKATILELYLNKIYLGNHSYGVEAAARNYFRKHAKDLNIGEAALLAGLPKNPSAYAPNRHPEAASRRQALVLKRMAEDGYLSPEVAAQWAAEPLAVAPGPEDYTHAAPYFTQAVAQELARKLELSSLPRRGLKIYTTLDARLQKAAAAQLGQAVAAAARSASRSLATANAKTKHPKPTAIVSEAKIEGALVSLDPRSGAVLAMQGGRDFRRSQFNRSEATKRPLGALFVPFYIALALENGYTLQSRVGDDPLGGTAIAESLAGKAGGGASQAASPTLFEALLAGSAWTAAPLYSALGDGTVRNFVKGFGLHFNQSDLTLALGSGEVSPTQVAAAYAAFANGGLSCTPTLITRVTTSEGQILYEAPNAVDAEERRALSPQAALQTQSALHAVLSSLPLAKTAAASPADSFALVQGGAAGVSEDLHDAWFVGTAPNLVSALWLGAETGQVRLAGAEADAKALAVQAWQGFMRAAPATYRHPRAQPAPGVALNTGRLKSGSAPPVQRD